MRSPLRHALARFGLGLLVSLAVNGWPGVSLAQQSAEITVEVRSPADGVLSATIATTAFTVDGDARPGGPGRLAHGTIDVWATDTTGSGTPWSVRAVIEGDFRSEQGDAIPASGLVLKTPVNAAIARSSAAGNVPDPATQVQVVAGVPEVLLRCADGDCQGVFHAGFDAELWIPDGTPTGRYTVTVLVEIVSEPGLL